MRMNDGVQGLRPTKEPSPRRRPGSRGIQAAIVSTARDPGLRRDDGGEDGAKKKGHFVPCRRLSSVPLSSFLQGARESCRGFSLVELSIVLVIMGLIIGGVLTGQQVIQNARITNAINAIQGYQAQFQAYAQNYGALPGDDPGAKGRFPNARLQTLDSMGDGFVGTGSSFDTDQTTGSDGKGESRWVWAHLRAADLVKNQVQTTDGATTMAVQPPNPFNGIYGFQNGAFGGVFTTTVLCLNKVPSTAAQAIDARLDDGKSDSGAIQATASGSGDGKVAESYGANPTFTLCVRM